MKKKHLRSRLFIDRPLQTAVLLRTGLYWAMVTMAQVLMTLFFGIVTSSQNDFPTLHPHVLWHLQITLLASVALLPIVLWDVLKLSHRWVGPIFRLRAALRTLSRGESIEEVRFRDRDFWQDLANDLNSLATEIERTRAARSETEASEDSEDSAEDFEEPVESSTVLAIRR
jgi:hypothetical protein